MIWIEALETLRVRQKGDVTVLRPGLPVEFAEAEGQRLLARAPGKVKQVRLRAAPLFSVGTPVLVGSSTPWCALVAWTLPQSPGGTTQAGWWYCVEVGTRWALVHESRLSAERAEARLTE